MWEHARRWVGGGNRLDPSATGSDIFRLDIIVFFYMIAQLRYQLCYQPAPSGRF